MKPVKIAMASLTHGHTRKYYQTLLDNEKLDWVASCAADPRAREVYASAWKRCSENIPISKRSFLLPPTIGIWRR